MSEEPVVVPVADGRRFRHELTPTWLTTTALLAGMRGPDLTRPFRVAWLGCGARFTPAVVAAVHPAAEVVAWDPDPALAAEVRRLADDADLARLAVHEEPEPPSSDQRRFDLVVVDGLLDSVEDPHRADLVAASAALTRPGGFVAVTHRTVVGWGEIAPVVHLIRHVVRSSPRPAAASVSDVKVLLEILDERGARYLAERPVVRVWLRDLLDHSAEEIVERYVRRPLLPVSHAQVAEGFARWGVSFVGSARMEPDPPDGLPAGLAHQVARAESPILRRTLDDLAVRRADRVDLYGLGAVAEAARVRSTAIRNLTVTSFAPVEAGNDDDDEIASRSANRSSDAPVTVKDLWPDAKAPQRERLLRRSLGAGILHPVLSSGEDPAVVEAAERLDEVLGASRVPTVHRHVVAPGLGTAVPVAWAETPERRRALGVERP